MRILKRILPVILPFLLLPSEASVIDSLCDLEAHLSDPIAKRCPFALDATVALDAVPEDCRLAVVDGHSAVDLRVVRDTVVGIKAGDRVRLLGFTAPRDLGGDMSACATNVILLGQSSPPPVLDATAADFLSGRCDARAVRLVGDIRDAQRDEIDPNYIYFTINCNNEILYAFSRLHDDEAELKRFVGVKAQVVGICIPYPIGRRMRTGRLLALAGAKSFTVLRQASDPNDLPEISALDKLRPIEVAHQGRHRASGHVLATWGNANLLLQKADGTTVGVKLSHCNLPRVGDFIDVVGFPNSDMYRLNLSKATWTKSASPFPSANPTVADVHIEDLFTDDLKRYKIKDGFHGQLIRFSGHLTRFLAQPSGSTNLMVECDKRLVCVNVDACPTAAADYPEGCNLEITGVCVMDIDNWRPDTAFPRIRGFLVVIRSADDLRMIDRPPWWTTIRLLTIIGLLALLLFGIFLWNLALRRLAERRGRELMDESIARAESAIKTLERTRLAVELHDSIAQSLTSVALEIMSAQQYPQGADPKMLSHLATASRRLDSCRTEIRNCLWDLRNQALEDTDMTSAIRRTLQPHIGNSVLSVRFNVPRERFTDNTTHDILCIIRELVLNGIRHGAASEIHVAGSMDAGRLRFSVKDNGCGFDPAHAPGVPQGHFGLEGIRERVERLGGDLSIASDSRGTKVTVTIIAKDPDRKDGGEL